MASFRIALFGGVGAWGLWLLFAPGVMAAPGPDETAESQTYEGTLTSRSGAEYSALLTFFGDPDRPRRVERGDLDLELMDTMSEEVELAALVLGSGRWMSFRWFFGNFWVAVTDTETGGRIFALGLANSERLRGWAAIFSDETLQNGWYRLSGEAAAPPEPLPE